MENSYQTQTNFPCRKKPLTYRDGIIILVAQLCCGGNWAGNMVLCLPCTWGCYLKPAPMLFGRLQYTSLPPPDLSLAFSASSPILSGWLLTLSLVNLLQCPFLSPVLAYLLVSRFTQWQIINQHSCLLVLYLNTLKFSTNFLHIVECTFRSCAKVLDKSQFVTCMQPLPNQPTKQKKNPKPTVTS